MVDTYVRPGRFDAEQRLCDDILRVVDELLHSATLLDH
jgi:hypothetical protein